MTFRIIENMPKTFHQSPPFADTRVFYSPFATYSACNVGRHFLSCTTTFFMPNQLLSSSIFISNMNLLLLFVFSIRIINPYLVPIHINKWKPFVQICPTFPVSFSCLLPIRPIHSHSRMSNEKKKNRELKPLHVHYSQLNSHAFLILSCRRRRRRISTAYTACLFIVYRHTQTHTVTNSMCFDVKLRKERRSN